MSHTFHLGLLCQISCLGLLYARAQTSQVTKSLYTSEYTIFKRLLRELRTQKGLTQVQLAQVLGMPQSFVSKYETGERRLDLIEIRVVCECLGMTLSEFVQDFEARLPKAKRRGMG